MNIRMAKLCMVAGLAWGTLFLAEPVQAAAGSLSKEEVKQSTQLQEEFTDLLKKNEPERLVVVLAKLEKLDKVAWERCKRLQQEAAKAARAKKVVELQAEFEKLLKQEEPERLAVVMAELEKLDKLTWEKCKRQQKAAVQQAREQKAQKLQQQLEAAIAKDDEAGAAAILKELEKVDAQPTKARQQLDQYHKDIRISMDAKLAEVEPRVTVVAAPAGNQAWTTTLTADLQGVLGFGMKAGKPADLELTIRNPVLRQIDAAGNFFRYEAAATAELVRVADKTAKSASDFHFDKSRELGDTASQATAIKGLREEIAVWVKAQNVNEKGGMRCFELGFRLGSRAGTRFSAIDKAIAAMPGLLSSETQWMDAEKQLCHIRLVWPKDRCPADPLAAISALPELNGVAKTPAP
jgi:hypothetical protein